MPVNPLYKFLSDMGRDGDSMGGRAFQAGRALWQDQEQAQSATPYIPTGLSDADIAAINAARPQQPAPARMPVVPPRAMPTAAQRAQPQQPQDFGPSATPYIPTGLSDTDIGAVNAFRGIQGPPRELLEERELGSQQIEPQPRNYLAERASEAQPIGVDIGISQRLPETTFGQAATKSGYDPRLLYAALAQFSGEFGNLKGTPTASSAPGFLDAQLGLEKQQRAEDLARQKLAQDKTLREQELQLRYRPKPVDAEKALKLELLKAQTDALRNKTRVDQELNDPQSERSQALKQALEIYVQKTANAPGFKTFEDLTGSDVYKWLGAMQFATGQQNTMTRNQFDFIGREEDRENRALEAEKTRQFQAQQGDLNRKTQRELAVLRGENQKELKQTVPGKAEGTSAGSKPATPDQEARAEQVKQMITENSNMDQILADKDFDPTSRLYMGQMNLPLGAKSSKWQNYETVAFQFLEPVLRKRTGAAVSEKELSSQMQQNFPVPGDTQETVKRKAVKRQQLIEEMRAWSGSAGNDLQTQPQAQTGTRTRKVRSLNDLMGQ